MSWILSLMHYQIIFLMMQLKNIYFVWDRWNIMSLQHVLLFKNSLVAWYTLMYKMYVVRTLQQGCYCITRAVCVVAIQCILEKYLVL